MDTRNLDDSDRVALNSVISLLKEKVDNAIRNNYYVNYVTITISKSEKLSLLTILKHLQITTDELGIERIQKNYDVIVNYDKFYSYHDAHYKSESTEPVASINNGIQFLDNTALVESTTDLSKNDFDTLIQFITGKIVERGSDNTKEYIYINLSNEQMNLLKLSDKTGNKGINIKNNRQIKVNLNKFTNYICSQNNKVDSTNNRSDTPIVEQFQQSGLSETDTPSREIQTLPLDFLPEVGPISYTPQDDFVNSNTSSQSSPLNEAIPSTFKTVSMVGESNNNQKSSDINENTGQKEPLQKKQKINDAPKFLQDEIKKLIDHGNKLQEELKKHQDEIKKHQDEKKELVIKIIKEYLNNKELGGKDVVFITISKIESELLMSLLPSIRRELGITLARRNYNAQGCMQIRIELKKFIEYINQEKKSDLAITNSNSELSTKPANTVSENEPEENDENVEKNTGRTATPSSLPVSPLSLFSHTTEQGFEHFEEFEDKLADLEIPPSPEHS